MFLDTTFCVDLMREHRRGEKGPATEKLEALGSTPIRVSIFVACELSAGARLARNPAREKHRLDRFLNQVELAHPGPELAEVYGAIEADLRSSGDRIGTMDVLIGATARLFEAPLLTRNDRDFRRIPKLRLESY
jgi:predicted nucleic acid-binding protein